MRDSQGTLYLLTLRALLGAGGTPILQPGPIDGGKADDRIAVSLGDAGAGSGSGPVTGANLLGVARLQPDAALEVTIPELGAIAGVRAPEANSAVTIVGRTTGEMSGRLLAGSPSDQYEARLLRTPGTTLVTGVWPAAVDLSAGDEGALVLDAERYAVGVVVALDPQVLIAPLPDVLANLDVALLAVGQELMTLSGPRREVEAAAFSGDGRWLAATSKDTMTFL